MDIKSFLQRSGISQTELAQRLETTDQNVSRWVKNKGTPSYEFCVKLLRLGITTAELFDVDSQTSTGKSTETTPSDFDDRVRDSILRLLNKT